MLPFTKSKLFKSSFVNLFGYNYTCSLFSSAYVTLESDAKQMFLKCVLLLHTIRRPTACAPVRCK